MSIDTNSFGGIGVEINKDYINRLLCDFYEDEDLHESNSASDYISRIMEEIINDNPYRFQQTIDYIVDDEASDYYIIMNRDLQPLDTVERDIRIFEDWLKENNIKYLDVPKLVHGWNIS